MNEKELKRVLQNHECNLKMNNLQFKNCKSIYETAKRSGAILIGENAVDLTSFEERIGAILEKILNEQKVIESLIDPIEQPYKTVIYCRYVALKTFDEIAEELNYSIQRIYQLHKKGLENLLQHFNTLE